VKLTYISLSAAFHIIAQVAYEVCVLLVPSSALSYVIFIQSD